MHEYLQITILHAQKVLTDPFKPEKFSEEIGRKDDNVESYYDDEEEFNRIQNRAQVREFRQSSPEPVPNKVKENKFYQFEGI